MLRAFYLQEQNFAVFFPRVFEVLKTVLMKISLLLYEAMWICSSIIVRNRISQPYKTKSRIRICRYNLYCLKQRTVKQIVLQIIITGSPRIVIVIQLFN
jgi:hypothetical protein